MKTISVHVYQFDELSDKAKEIAREWYKKDYPDQGWWDTIYDDAKEAAKFLGVEITDIRFSGFWSQGDGACFIGRFRSEDLKTLDELKENYPLEGKLHTLLEQLHAVEHPAESWISIGVYGHYSHSGTMTFDDYGDGYEDEAFDEVKKCLRSFADWIYMQLEKEHEYLTSDSYVDELITAVEYWFLVDGSRSILGDD